jgi:hypothetical protein
MSSILSDHSKFAKLTEPVHKFTMRIEDKINNFLRKLKKLKHITDAVYDHLHVSGSGPGILYGLPKIHKIDFRTKFQFRPIFASYNSPSYKLAKFLVPVLAPITMNEFTLENSHQFAETIAREKNANQYVMASFDVENLFTNIPLVETIDICVQLLFSNSSNIIGLTRVYFKTLLENAVLNSFFIFNGECYRQTEGLGMGLPLGPTLANIFMCYHESSWLADCPDSFRPIFYRRYIDDTFILFRQLSHASDFLNYLNSKHPNIKFTMECENNGKLSFLDCTVSRHDNKFKCSVFRKSTFSGLGLSYFSFCCDKFKINSVKTLLSRAYKICSDFSSLHSEFDFLRSFFLNNGYPIFLIDKQIRNFLSKRFAVPTIYSTVEKRKLFVSFPYLVFNRRK